MDLEYAEVLRSDNPTDSITLVNIQPTGPINLSTL